MKYANVTEKIPGPSIIAMPRTDAIAPCNFRGLAGLSGLGFHLSLLPFPFFLSGFPFPTLL